MLILFVLFVIIVIAVVVLGAVQVLATALCDPAVHGVELILRKQLVALAVIIVVIVVVRMVTVPVTAFATFVPARLGCGAAGCR